MARRAGLCSLLGALSGMLGRACSPRVRRLWFGDACTIALRRVVGAMRPGLCGASCLVVEAEVWICCADCMGCGV